MKFSMAIVISVMAACSGSSPQEPIIGPTDGTQPIAIVNVNVVPMDTERVLVAQTVVVRDGRVAQMGSASTITPPADALVIDARGGYLIPGLIDMHVHIRSAEIEEYLRAGVTSVRNLWGYNELPAHMRDIDNGTRRGPKIFSLTAGFDGSPPFWPQTQISDDPTVIAPLIDRQYELGFREVKVYQKLTRAAYDTIVAVARRKGMTFAGHTPSQVGLNHVLASGQRSIEHLGGYATGSGLGAQVAATLQAGTYNCPTMAILAMLNPASVAAANRQIVGALHRGGARLLVGTDSGIDRTQPGISIYDELEEFVAAGLTPYQALLGATRTGAEYLAQSANIGGIATGMEADLVLLRANPLNDVRAVRGVRAVIHDGKVF